jgi:O-antigen/teichoic acid export membrane protein
MKKYMSQIPKSRTELSDRINTIRKSVPIMSAFWVIFSSGSCQSIRMIGNIVTTSLLMPEYFGIMAIAHTVMIGIGQLSDVGLREGVVNSKRIDDPHFMETAWTLQIVRALFIGIGGALIAFPVANFYEEPTLLPVMIMIGFSYLIHGFKTIAVLRYDKNLDLKSQMLFDIGLTFVASSITIVWASISPTIWAFVGASILTNIIDVIASYIIFKGHHSKLCWDRKAVHDLFHFGKWIFLSSAISFIAVQGDKLIMGVWLTMTQLGQYAIASTWSAIILMVSYPLSTRVLMPLFRQKIEVSATDFSDIHRTRLRLNMLFALACVGLAIIGDIIVKFLYDSRYQEAGWMLQVLMIGQLGRICTSTLRPFLTANEDSKSQMKTSMISTVILIILLVGGNYLAGPAGLIIGFSLSGIAMHPIMIWYAHKHNYYCFRADMGIIASATGISFIAWWAIDSEAFLTLKSIFDSIM